MGLDIRLPIGLLFSLLGLILAGFGVISNANSAMYARSLDYNVNLWWGLVVLAFGLLFLWLGRRGVSTTVPAEVSPEGRAIEEMEFRTGLESDNPVVDPE